MDFKILTKKMDNLKETVLVIGIFEQGSDTSVLVKTVDQKLNRQIKKVIIHGDFLGQKNTSLLLYSVNSSFAEHVLLVGLGKESQYNTQAIRLASAVAIKALKSLHVPEIGFDLSSFIKDSISLASISQAICEGAGLALYEFKAHKTGEKVSKQFNISIISEEQTQNKSIEEGIKSALAVIKGTTICRDLVNYPPNYLTPTVLAEKAQELTKDTNIKSKVLNKNQLIDLGMGGLLGVAAGSKQEPKFIILEYDGKDSKDTIVLVGKGITFDSGGISIKPADGMERMKSDMAGAAAVVGALLAICELGLPIHLVVLIPATENMPGGQALKPGDILNMFNGKTVEVINTDAEGRLILADALSYAEKYNPTLVIDIATLTGSRTIALGDYACGLFTNDNTLVDKFTKAGNASWERIWQMPLFDEYGEDLKSFSADFKNQSGRSGGACVAAAFLKKFVTYPWVHLDIAGLATSESERPYMPGWATGFGTRLLTQFVRDWVS